MNITTLFLDCIVFTLDMDVILNLPMEGHVADYDWFLVTSDVYCAHRTEGGVHVDDMFSFEQYIIARKKE